MRARTLARRRRLDARWARAHSPTLAGQAAKKPDGLVGAKENRHRELRRFFVARPTPRPRHRDFVENGFSPVSEQPEPRIWTTLLSMQGTILISSLPIPLPTYARSDWTVGRRAVYTTILARPAFMMACPRYLVTIPRGPPSSTQRDVHRARDYRAWREALAVGPRGPRLARRRRGLGPGRGVGNAQSRVRGVWKLLVVLLENPRAPSLAACETLGKQTKSSHCYTKK